MMGSGRIASCITVLCVVRTSVHRWNTWRAEQMQTLSGLRSVQKATMLCETGNDQQCCYSTGCFIWIPTVCSCHKQMMETLATVRGSLSPHSLSLHPGSLTVGLVLRCQTIHGRDRNCTPPQLPPEWIATLLFIVLGIVSLTIACGLMVTSRWCCEASRYARWIAFVGSTCSHSPAFTFTPSQLCAVHMLNVGAEIKLRGKKLHTQMQ